MDAVGSRTVTKHCWTKHFVCLDLSWAANTTLCRAVASPGMHPSAGSWNITHVLAGVSCVGLTVIDCRSGFRLEKKINLFLSEAERFSALWNGLERYSLVWKHTQINHGNSEAVPQRLEFIHHSAGRKMCLAGERPCHSPAQRAGRSVLRPKHNSHRLGALLQGQLFDHWHLQTLGKRIAGLDMCNLLN